MAGGGVLPDSAGQISGRQRERDQLRELLARSDDESGALVLVSGSAGIGKTTLVNDLTQTARASGCLVLWGGCYALTSTPPYGLWAEVFRGHQPETGMPEAPSWLLSSELGVAAENQQALHEELRRFLHDLAAAQPVVVVLEDIHWSDPASLDALRYVARRHQIPPILIVATLRHDEIAPHQPLYQMLPLIARESGSLRIELQAFSEDEIRALVRARYELGPEDESRLVDDLRARTAGNPFFVTELLRVFESERLLGKSDRCWRLDDLTGISVPPLVRQAIETWLARLEGDDRRLLEIAAVIGQKNLAPELWADAGGVDIARITATTDRAIEAGLLVPDAGPHSVRFTHALVQETLYQRLPLSQRRAIHGDVAEILASLSQREPNASPDAVASHFAQANDPRAIGWLIRSGERALALYAARDAADAFSRAHKLAIQFSEHLPTGAYQQRASAFMMLGEFEPARRDLDRVLERACETGDRMLEWQTLIDLALLWAERDYERCGSYCRAALDLARDIEDRPTIARSLNRIANWHINMDDPERALPLHQEALAIFEAVEDQQGIADTLDFLGMASYLNRDYPSSAAHYERAASLFRELGDRQRLSTCLAMLGLNGGDLDVMARPSYREAAYWFRSGEEALEIAREINWPAGEAFALEMLSMATAGHGEFERSLDCAREALEIAERIDHREWTVMARYTLGRTWMELYQTERAVRELELAVAEARRAGWHLGAALASATLAWLYASIGDAGRSAAALGTLDEPAPSNRSMAAHQRRHAKARLRLVEGDVDSALELVDDLVPLAAESEQAHGSGSSPLLLKLRGDVMARAERFEEAELAYRLAAECAELYGFLPLLWRIEAAREDLYRSSGRIREADAAHQAARATIQRLAAEISDDELRATFRSKAEALLNEDFEAASDAWKMTPRELDVLRHLVEGKTDREIADELFISPRTVMRHVASILSKLDVSSRTAAATFAVRHDLV